MKGPQRFPTITFPLLKVPEVREGVALVCRSGQRHRLATPNILEMRKGIGIYGIISREPRDSAACKTGHAVSCTRYRSEWGENH